MFAAYPTVEDYPVQLTKSQVRAKIVAARKSLSRTTRDTEAEALAHHLDEVIAPSSTVCAYVPVGSEPGSLALVDGLDRRGVVVLLPVARHDAAGVPEPLRWGRYRREALVAAPFGLREPGPPWLPADAVATASVVLVPALAVDRTGVRLGRGAGFYDRTLPLAGAGVRLVAVVRDDEVVDELPAEPHDVRMTHVLTPGAGLVPLGATPPL